MPRTYQVEACMREYDNAWTGKLTATPGKDPGAQLPFEDVLTQEIREEVINAICFVIFYTNQVLLAEETPLVELIPHDFKSTSETINFISVHRCLCGLTFE